VTDRRAKAKIELVERVFQGLAHATRRQILMTIHFRGGAMSAGEIAARFGHTWATTTGHLNALVESGLLKRQKEGRKRIYRLDAENLAAASEWLAWLAGDADEQIATASKAKPIPSTVADLRDHRRGRGKK